MNHQQQQMQEKLQQIYGVEKAERMLYPIHELIDRYQGNVTPPAKSWVDEKDIMLITYADSIQEDGKVPLQTLHQFLKQQVADVIAAVHLLPFYPYSSDDGFSVIDYRKVNPDVGDWPDVTRMAQDFDLMFDAVINHISQQSEWFQQYLKGNPRYQDYFVEADPHADYSDVTRPRALPLLTKFETDRGTRYLWTTFSADQIDLNYESERLLLEILDILLTYVQMGARFLRLDAIGFLWKRLGTTCIHLQETHLIVQLIREVLESVAPGTLLITETNVPHQDNIRYFGNGSNEAHLVYQFPLPPLTLHAFHSGSSQILLEWADTLEPTSDHTTFFNFLASHDGIGVRPVEGILTAEQVQAMMDRVQAHGGLVSYRDNGDGTQSPYELNINYLDALSHPDDPDELKVKRFLAAQAILLSMVGVPGIYIHSLLGSRNDGEGVKRTGHNRAINREKLDRPTLERELDEKTHLRHHVFHGMKTLLAIRRSQRAFHPNASQHVLFLDDRVFSILREYDDNESVIVLVNVANETVSVTWPPDGIAFETFQEAKDLVSDQMVSLTPAEPTLTLVPYQVMWLKQ